ncbi:AcrR family transcriptional regulator [Sphingobium xenophagum]|uniref:AcrR family transcriptional regulator n=1 Tax=Sphingobium xenophagum TaxID=121428 RepID=A0ABU1X2B4_SPHXE|nr:CerR family C-terminal domain-containing protein [Sphingobium xenophagum]MDR7155720.1 AcrR family transcriptional regulator [Sphingobium xenophagum]
MIVTPRRPLRSDGEATRTRLLESAGALIADLGYAETTGKAIAAHAGVDLASINYHFGSRDGLYRAVLVEAHRRLVRLEALEEISTKKIPPGEKLRELLEIILFNGGDAKNWSIKVLMREMISPSSHFNVLKIEGLTPSLDSAVVIISEITGIPYEEPLLFHSLLCSVAPCLMLILSGTAIVAQDRPRLSPDKLLDHMHSFALAGLKAAAVQYHAGRL